MKIIIMMVFSLWAIGCASESPIEGLSFPLKTPKDIAVEHLSVVDHPGGIQDRTKEVFISDGRKWRLECEKPGKGIKVILYNAIKIHANIGQVVPDAVYDWRKHFEELYKNLDLEKYVALENVGQFNCWRFTLEEGDEKVDVWIDSKLIIPRKWIIQYADGEIETDYFFDYMEPIIDRHSLFDASNVKPNLIGFMVSDWDDLY